MKQLRIFFAVSLLAVLLAIPIFPRPFLFSLWSPEPASD